jgi:hypothetical protein
MSLDPTSGLLLGALLAVAGGLLAWAALRGGAFGQRKALHVDCPMFGAQVECEAVQDVRTGQWKEIRSCSAFAGMAPVPCDKDCARLLNLGLLPPRAART